MKPSRTAEPTVRPESPHEPTTRLLTVKQAAEKCQLSERQIRRMIAEGKLQARHFGRAVRIHPKQLGL